MANIKDVARKSRVSIATVSNVLNNVPTVSKAIRKSVEKAIKELNYKPNLVAKSLAKGRTQTIACIIPDICNPFFPELVRGATDKASQLGYNLFLGNIDNDSEKEIEYIRNFVSQGVDGIIIATSDCSDKNAERLNEIKDLGIPVVMVDRELEGLDRDLVVVDNIKCAYSAVLHLIEMGYRKIGIILGPMNTWTATQRFEGAKKALEEKNISQKFVYSGAFAFETGFRAMQNFLQKNGKQIDAIFCANDMIAIGALKGIEQSGYRVPEDIGVIGFDDLYISSLIKPALTTIHQPTNELGTIAVNMLIERIQGQTSGIARKIILPGELVIRESTRKHY